MPAPVHLVKVGADDVDTEPVVAAQIEPVGNVAQLGEDLRLCGEALGPCPALLQRLVE
jgi:hypothetical protein